MLIPPFQPKLPEIAEREQTPLWSRVRPAGGDRRRRLARGRRHRLSRRDHRREHRRWRGQRGRAGLAGEHPRRGQSLSSPAATVTSRTTQAPDFPEARRSGRSHRAVRSPAAGPPRDRRREMWAGEQREGVTAFPQDLAESDEGKHIPAATQHRDGRVHRHDPPARISSNASAAASAPPAGGVIFLPSGSSARSSRSGATR